MSRLRPGHVLAAAMLAWTAGAVVMWLGRPLLGHDEAQYVIDATDYLTGIEPRWFYLSPGMRALAVPGVLAGGTELTLRALPLLVGIAFLGVLARLGAQTVGLASAAWAVATLAGFHTFARWNIDLLSDLPATTLMLGALCVIVAELFGEHPPRWRLLAVAPLLAGAFYVRYGSIVPIAVIVLAALALGARRIAERPAPVAATAALFVALLGPHFAAAIAQTGSPLGLVFASSGVPGRAYLGEGLVDYVTSNPVQLYGWLAAPVLLAGLTALRRHVTRRALFLWLVAVGDLVALGIVSHARARYIYLALALLTLFGVDAIRRAVAARPVLRALAAAAVAAALAWTLRGQAGHARARDATMPGTRLAAAAIRRDAPRLPCRVIGAYYTRLEYYSGCTTRDIPTPSVYVVVDHSPGVKRPSPQPDISAVPGRHTTLLLIPGLVEVVRSDLP